MKRSDGVGLPLLDDLVLFWWGFSMDVAQPTSSMRWSMMSDMGESHDDPVASIRSISDASNSVRTVSTDP
jgi:hypothetical protein